METPRKPVIAIDGPAGAGKSTVARLVAQRLGYTYIDTGALFRATAYVARLRGIDWENGEAIAELANTLVIRFETISNGQLVIADDMDVTGFIRTQEISIGASIISGHREVMEVMIDKQKELGANGGVVMEGRIIGTVIFPDAEVKIFLDALPETRATRICKAGDNPHEVLRNLNARDERDYTRKTAPLKRADDAVTVWTDGISTSAVVSRILTIFRNKIGSIPPARC